MNPPAPVTSTRTRFFAPMAIVSSYGTARVRLAAFRHTGFLARPVGRNIGLF